MSQTSRNHRSTSAFLRSKSEAHARPLDERAVDPLEWELWKIDVDHRVHKQGGECARFVRAQRVVA